MAASPFLQLPESEWLASNDLAFAIYDRYPVSPGHALVIPRRVVATWFEATADERAAILDLIDRVKPVIDDRHHPDGYNIGINVGSAAGQTVMHLHVHVIPRYRGDVLDPRGGVRHVIPPRANYLAERALATGGEDPFLSHVQPLLARASDVAIVAAFVQDSGLAILEESVFSALERGARIRVLTSDYLHITQADGLRRLLDWMSEWAAGEESTSSGRRGELAVRVVEVGNAGGRPRAFHPKSWRFEGDEISTAFVGSSNVSRSALTHGIEWNLRIDRSHDPSGYREVVEAFDVWWERGQPLTLAWVERYARQAREQSRALPPGEEEPQPWIAPPAPNAVQMDALAALAGSRAQGRDRALIVLATGLGKTWLAAFDVQAFAAARRAWPRVLFVAHRAELLQQAAETFRRLFRDVTFGWLVANERRVEGDVVFASVQKLSRDEYLRPLPPRAFDYMIIDEVHHAAAPSYQKILSHLEPAFLIGLTATPDRADEADLLGLFDDHLAHRVDLGAGIARGMLAPFRYFGLKDTVDYAPIPWRNRRFDPEALALAVQTVARMEKLWEAWQAHPGTRTLIFCCSIDHARFVRDWLSGRGVAAEAVHCGPGSADRSEALRHLAGGQLQALCAVDILNEGIDIPAVDRVVMLRPTESPVIFLQQLGRGLRKLSGKDALTVIDFVGNHRVFLDRVRLLLSLEERTSVAAVRQFLADGEADLPPGCSVEIEVAAIDLLEALLPRASKDAFVQAYRDLRAARETRPTAIEMFHLGYNPASLRAAYGGWFRFLEDQGDLAADERDVLSAAQSWFEDLEQTPMTKSFKMVVLQVLLDAGTLLQGMPLDELASRCHARIVRSPELLEDIEDVKAFSDPRRPSPSDWRTYWLKNPVSAWKNTGWFDVEGERLVPRLTVPPHLAPALSELTAEIVDYRLAQYRARVEGGKAEGAFEARVVSNQRDPIIKLPSRKRRPDLPQEDAAVELPGGEVWRFRWMKEFINVARPAGAHRNQLPDLLRSWFGPSAGRPGTAFRVRLTPSAAGWRIEPVGVSLPEPIARDHIVAYPHLRAAAGAQAESTLAVPEAHHVALPGRYPPDAFAVRATGSSMDGGREPIRDGDWVVLRWARGLGIGAVLGRVALVEVGDPDTGVSYHLKRVVQDGGRFVLRSDNPDVAPMEADSSTVPLALHVATVRPEDIAPPAGTVLSDVGHAFGLSHPPVGPVDRVDGHLFISLDGPPAPPALISAQVPDHRPGETAYVLHRALPADPWRYVGVARWQDDRWGFPPPSESAPLPPT